MEKPLVSVNIVTYNHAEYIKNAIEGALMQKTTFPFEILVGEDESNDGTREICKEYAETFPDKIRLILNNRKNVIYINGKPTGRWNMLNLIRESKGKYIAFCEGDDYWIDPFKLQKQVDVLERNEDISFCFSGCLIIDVKKLQKVKNIRRFIGNHTFTIIDIIKKGGAFCPTPSIVMRTEYLKKLPIWVKESPAADYFITILAGLKGDAYYFDEPQVVYRAFSIDSWTERINVDKKLVLKTEAGLFYSLLYFNNETNSKYINSIRFVLKTKIQTLYENNLISKQEYYYFKEQWIIKYIYNRIENWKAFIMFIFKLTNREFREHILHLK